METFFDTIASLSATLNGHQALIAIALGLLQITVTIVVAILLAQ